MSNYIPTTAPNVPHICAGAIVQANAKVGVKLSPEGIGDGIRWCLSTSRDVGGRPRSVSNYLQRSQKKADVGV